MLHILIVILKILGILVVSLLALLLLAVLLLLFAPVSYRAQAEYRDGLRAQGRLRWLYPLLSVSFRAEGSQQEYRIRILGIPVGKKKGAGKASARTKKRRKKRGEPKRSDEQGRKAGDERTERSGPDLTEGKTGGESQRKIPEDVRERDSTDRTNRADRGDTAERMGEGMPSQEDSPSRTDKSTDSPDPAGRGTAPAGHGNQPDAAEQADGSHGTDGTGSDGRTAAKEQAGHSKGKELWNRIAAFVRWVRDFLRRLPEVLGNLKQRLLDRLRGLWGTVSRLMARGGEILAFLREESTKSGILTVFAALKKLLRHLKPKRLRLSLRYGTGDAYTLARHLIGFSLLYGLCGEWLEVRPDWENKVLEAEGMIKGRIRVFTLLRICIKVVRDKNVKKIRKQFREFKNGGEKSEAA